jgi:hypothetical protein
MKIGLDIHGVSDKLPEFFSEFSKIFVESGHEIHIMTGSHIEKENIKEKLNEIGISYTHLFSIADYHKEYGSNMWYDEKGNPWVSNEDWDKTKADYARRENLDLVIDDTKRYHKHFTTPFMYAKIYKDGEQEAREETSKPKEMIGFQKWLTKKISWFTHPTSKLGKEERNKTYQ